jgi:flagellar biosynthetic protein FliP
VKDAKPPSPRRSREKVFTVPAASELKRAALLSLITTLVCLAWPIAALAQEAAQSGSAINIDLGTGAGLTQRVVQLVGLMTVLSLAPSIVIMTTSFVRIVVVLSLLRTALGMQQTVHAKHHLDGQQHKHYGQRRQRPPFGCDQGFDAH